MPVTAKSQIASVLMLGAISQIGQVLFLRELLMVFHGNELSMGLILAAWLFWTGLGSRLGAFLAERARNAFSLLALNSAGLILLLPGSIFGIRILRGFFDILPGAYLSVTDMILACFLLLAPACLLLGIQFVALSRAWREGDGAKDTTGAAKTYVGEAAGNMLGGVAFTFLLLHYLNSFQNALLVGFLLLASVSVLVIRSRGAQPSSLQSLSLLALLVLALFLSPFLSHIERVSHQIQWRQLAPQHQLEEVRQSQYGKISVLQRENQYSFFQSGQLLFSTAERDDHLFGLEEQPAAELAHLSMVQQESPENVLLIGGGLRGTLSHLLQHPVKRVDYIELDEVLMRTAMDYVPRHTVQALQDPRVNIRHVDGRLFVKQAQEEYDLILLDAPDPTTAALNRYYTRGFFREAKELLTPEGALVLGANSTPDMRDTAVANRNSALYHTLGSVFPQVKVAGQDFLYFFASPSREQISVDPHLLIQRFEGRDIRSDSFSPHHFRLLLQESDVRRVNWIVHHHGRSPLAHLEGPEPAPLSPGSLQEQASRDLPEVNEAYFLNRDLKPIGYYYSLMFWDRLTRAERTEALQELLRVQFWWAFPLLGLVLALGLGLRAAGGRSGKPRAAPFSLMFTVFSTGLSTMLLQVALLFTFQSIYGFVYEMVGLIVALFMCGLGLGAAAANRFVGDKSNINHLALVQICMTLLAGVIALGLPLLGQAQSPALLFAAFSSLTFLAGLLNGLDFPLAAACYHRLSRRPDKSAGAVYGLELFGACLGAILASLILAPIHGIAACFLLAALGNGTAFVLLYLSRREYEILQGKKQ